MKKAPNHVVDPAGVRHRKKAINSASILCGCINFIVMLLCHRALTSPYADGFMKLGNSLLLGDISRSGIVTGGSGENPFDETHGEDDGQ